MNANNAIGECIIQYYMYYTSFALVVVVQFFHESGGVIGTVILDDVSRVKVVDLVNVLSQFRARRSLDLLHLLQAFRKHKRPIIITFTSWLNCRFVGFWRTGAARTVGYPRGPRKSKAQVRASTSTFIGWILEPFWLSF